MVTTLLNKTFMSLRASDRSTSHNGSTTSKQSDSVKQQVVDQHPELFHGLGTIEGEYNTKLKSDAKPYALATLWNENWNIWKI